MSKRVFLFIIDFSSWQFSVGQFFWDCLVTFWFWPEIGVGRRVRLFVSSARLGLSLELGPVAIVELLIPIYFYLTTIK